SCQSRSYEGSPTPGGGGFHRIIPSSRAYEEGLPPRPAAKSISESLEEDPSAARTSSTISLGLVFFGQFVDHDLDTNLSAGQGPSADPGRPINIRTPALDLDSVYGAGPEGTPEYFTADGLFFRLRADGADLLRDEHGRALIGDDRNDENGFVAAVHLAFQK